MAKTRDANRILDDVTGDDEALQQMIAEETVNAEVARLIHEARKMAGLTQTELVELIGSKQPVYCDTSILASSDLVTPSAKRDRINRSTETEGSPASILATRD